MEKSKKDIYLHAYGIMSLSMNGRGAGYTLVEIVITLAVAGLFTMLFIESFQAISSQREATVRYVTSQNIAKTNLDKYRSVSSAGASCQPANLGAEIPLLTNTTGNPESVPTGLYPNFSQSVVMIYRHGCDAPPTVISTVSYGSSGSEEEVRQVSYAK